MEIEWRKVIGNRGTYYVSNTGIVKNAQTGKILHPWGSNGYQRVAISGLAYDYVHRLVATAFVPNPQNRKEVDHIDGIRKNNYASNLRWVSRLENVHNDITSKHHADRILETHRTNEFRNKLSAARNDPEFQKRIRPNYENAWKKRRGSKNICHRKKVRCIETGEIWNSCTDLAKQFNVSSSAVYNWINHRKENSKAGPCYGALHFEYVNKEDCNVH